MPVLAVPAIALVVAALLAILVLLAWEILAKAITNMVPAWHVPGLGSFRGWIESHLKDGLNAITGYLDSHSHALIALVTYPVILFKKFFTGFVVAFSATHLLLWAILNHTVPVAMSELRRFALAQVAMLEAQALSWYHLALKNANDLAKYVLGQAVMAVTALRADALNWYHLALKNANDLAGYVLGQAVMAVTALRADALNWYRLSLHYADDLAGYVQAQSVALYHSALATIETRYQAALAFAAGAAKTEATAVLTGLNDALITDIEHAWPIVISGIDDVIDAAAGEFSDVVGDLRSITRALPRDLPAAIAATTALAIPLLRLAKDCTMPNCRNLSQIGRDLQALFAAVESGAIIGLLAEAANDPAGLANAVRSTLGPLVSSAVGAVKSEVGVN